MLNGSNYPHWKLKMCRILEAKDLDEIVYGNELEPVACASKADAEAQDSDAMARLAAALSNFKKKNARASMILINSLDEKNLTIVAAYRLARDIWTRLELEYADKEPISLEALLTEFYTLKKQPGQSVSEYVAHIDMLVLKMSQLKTPMDQAAIMAKITTSLPQEYSNFKRSWDMTPNQFKSMDLLLSNLKKEEVALAEVGIPGGALYVRSKQNHGSARQKPDKKNSKCKWCQQPGHWWKECPTRPADKKPSNLGKKQRQRQPVHQTQQSSEQEDWEPRKGLFHRMVPSSDQGEKMDQPRLYHRMAIMGKLNDERGFYIDSGCSAHFTGQLDWLQGYKPLLEKYPIQVGNGEYLYAVGIGHIDCVAPVGKKEVKLRLNKVHYVPGLSENLFSVGAAMAAGVHITFSDDKALVMDGKETLAVGHKAVGNLYRLDIRVPMKANIVRTERTCDEWHSVFGHADTKVIKDMASNGCVQGMKIVEAPRKPEEGCGDCQAGRGKCASHPSSTRERATEVLERIHMDLVGPINPPSVGGKVYFLLVRDEYSTYLFVELLSSKAEVSDKLKQFIDRTYMTTQRRVKFMRSDQGSEFKNIAISQICDMYGIVSDFSAVYTPQQNGEAERANQTIIGTARTNLQASGLPLKLWAEAVNHAVYVRNRLPNTRTDGKTPFELFYGHKPDVSHMIRFGQPVHIINYSRGRGKFDSKTREAFMVGYGPRVNTYRCMLTNLEDVVITADCVPASHSNREKLDSPQPSVSLTIGGEIATRPSASLVHEQGPAQPGESSREERPALEEQGPATPVRRSSLQEVGESGRLDLEAPGGDSPSNVNNNTFDILPHHSRYDDSATSAPSSSRQQHVSFSRNVDRINTPQVEISRSDLMRKTNDLSRVGLQGEQMSLDGAARAIAARPLAPSVRQSARVADRVLRSAASRQVNVEAPNSVQRSQVSLQRSATITVPQRESAAQPRTLIERLTPALSRMMRSDKEKSPMRNMVAKLSNDNEPQSYREAISGPDGQHWLIAINQELMALEKMETWSIVKLPPDAEEITAKWVFKRKILPDGTVDRFKARLVARGFNQREGVDYTEVFAPVVRIDSVRLLISLCAQLGLHYYQFDIATAFLNGVIDEELYLRPPDGLKIEEGHTLRLKRSLYGLKQSPRCWGARFKEVAAMFGMQPTLSDPCVYSKKGDRPLFLALYVDDGLVFGARRADMQAFIEHLKVHFQVNEVNSSCFVGVEINRHPDGSIFINQAGYIDRMLERYGMSDCKGAASPMAANHALNRPEVLDQPPLDIPEYAAAVGSLLWCAISTRPDIAYALSVLSKHTRSPREAHWKAVKRVFRYLKATRDHGLIYAKMDEPELLCYSDADWAGDQESRLSTSGMVTLFSSGPVSFKAQQQPVVALSTTEAEYISASLAVKDLIWIQRFMVELGVSLESKPRLLCDNQSAIKLIKNPEFHQRSKHIDIRYHFIRIHTNQAFLK